jgi:hypothetical protein
MNQRLIQIKKTTKTLKQHAMNQKLKVLRFAVALAVGAASISSSRAQGIVASGQITATGSGPFNYSLTVSNSGSATSPIGSFWYAWIPGQFYLPTVPSSAHAPAGWTDSIVGDSIQFIASSSANYIAPGSSLGGFGFTSTDTPAAIGGNAPAYPGTPVGTTVAYAAGLFSLPSETFVFTSVVPEPSAMSLLLAGSLGVLAGGWRKCRA